MEPRTPDTHNPENLSYLCSRQYEDYLDWLENQNRTDVPWFRPFRLLGTLTGGIALVVGVIFLIS
jgi:hypothetical protein